MAKTKRPISIHVVQEGQDFVPMTPKARTVGALAKELKIQGDYVASNGAGIANDATLVNDGDVVSFVVENKSGG